MHLISECPVYAEDRKHSFEKMKIEPELVDKNSSMNLVMNPGSFEGWKYLIQFKKNVIRIAQLNYHSR